MKHQTQYLSHPPSLLSRLSSVRVRLTLWYFATTTLILLALGGSVYASQVQLSANAVDNQVETQLYQDAQPLTDTYKQALLAGQSPASQHVTLSPHEIVLLLRSDGTILDTRGPLTSRAIQQVQAKAERSQAPFNLTLPLTQTHNWGWGWWSTTNEYRIVITPILQKDSRLAILMVGLPRENHSFMPTFWLVHGIILLLISLTGGYWLASKALRPVQMITRMANEINATDLRRRLHLKRRDEFGELAATFDQMLSRLEAAFKRQSQFTADASHELRTPLTIIELEINRALTQLPPSTAYGQVLEQIQAENEQMIAIVNSLLLLARADTGRIELHQEEVDLSDIALGAVERLLSVAQQSQITLSTGDLPELLVVGDPQYLNRIVMNLVENGIKYTRGIGTRVHVELACEQERWGVIRVQDDGPGIAEEHLPYLFERFYRVDKARSHGQSAPIRPANDAALGLLSQPANDAAASSFPQAGWKESSSFPQAGRKEEEQSRTMTDEEGPGGTGLGLSIVQWIVQAHGGEVRVESKIGTGSLFEVRLPLRSAPIRPANDAALGRLSQPTNDAAASSFPQAGWKESSSFPQAGRKEKDQMTK
jgi:signal transduction histidine kinase